MDGPDAQLTRIRRIRDALIRTCSVVVVLGTVYAITWWMLIEASSR